MDAHTHTRTHTQTRTLARTHAHTHTKKVTDTDTYIQTRTHTETYTRIHTASQTQSHTQPLSHTRAHTHKHTQTHTRAHACIVSFTHADFCAAKRPMEPKRLGQASFVGACVVACRCGLHGRCGPAGSIFQNRALVGAPRRCMRCSARTGHPNRRRSGQFETHPTQIMFAFGIPWSCSPQRVGPPKKVTEGPGTMGRSQARPGRETLANFCVCFFQANVTKSGRGGTLANLLNYQATVSSSEGGELSPILICDDQFYCIEFGGRISQVFMLKFSSYCIEFGRENIRQLLFL